MDILSDVNVSGSLKVNNTLWVCGTVAFGCFCEATGDIIGSYCAYGIGIYGDNNEKRLLYVTCVKSFNANVENCLHANTISTNNLKGLKRYTEFEYLQTKDLETSLFSAAYGKLMFSTPYIDHIGPLTYYINHSVTVPPNCSKFFILQNFCTGGENNCGRKIYPVIQSVSSDKTNFVDYEFSFCGDANEKISVIGSITPNATNESAEFNFQLLFPTISSV